MTYMQLTQVRKEGSPSTLARYNRYYSGIYVVHVKQYVIMFSLNKSYRVQSCRSSSHTIVKCNLGISMTSLFVYFTQNFNTLKT